MEKHVAILGGLYVGVGAVHIFIALTVFVAIAGGGLLSGDHTAMAITAGVATAIALFLILIAAPGIIGGLGLLKHQAWARILVLVLGFLNLLALPFGTILGIYTIWVFMANNTDLLFGPWPGRDTGVPS
jgi:hypothetical protein